MAFAILNTIQRIRTNNQIVAPEVRVIGNLGENLGVMTSAAALELAKQQGLDLIEISATAKPPVARIMSFDKYRYMEEKKLKKQRASEKTGGYKRVQIGVKTAANDLNIKAKKADDFLAAGYTVEIMLSLRGREKAHKDFAMEKLRQFIKMINPDHKMIVTPRFGGRGIVAQVAK